MRILLMVGRILILSLIVNSPVYANEGSEGQYPRERFNLKLGGMFSLQDSSFTFSENLSSPTIDGEDLLGLDEEMVIFRGESFYRFGERHKIHA